MKAEVLQNGLRKKAIETVRLCAECSFDKSLTAARQYREMVDREIKSARAAIASVEGILNRAENTCAALLNRREAAAALGVTTETVRTWERSGLINGKKTENRCRVYSSSDMERFNIIRTLRCADYSLTAILRLLNGLDRHTEQSVESALNTPDENEDIVSVCDALIVSLENTAADADMLISMTEKIKEKFSTIQ